jgi:UDP-glucose 4-epimerase
MRVLVTGGAGFIGSHAVLELRRAGHEVLVFDNFMRGHRETISVLDVPYVEGDLCREGDIEKAFATGPFDAVLHFAAVALVAESMRDPGLYFSINVAGGLRLLSAMRAANCRRLIFSSTAAVYGLPDSQPIAESSPLAPCNPYGQSKLAFEQMMRCYAQAYDMRCLALRYFNAAGCDAEAGLGELHHPETHLIPSILKVPLGISRTAVVFGTDYPTRDGSCERDFIHVTDLAKLHVRALEVIDGLEVPALNLGTGRGATVREVIASARRITGRDFSVVNAPRRAGDPPALVADPSLAERLLGYRAERSLDDMIASAWAWLSEHRDRLDQSARRRFGEAAISAGLLNEAQLQAALDVQRAQDERGEERRLLGLLLVEMGVLQSYQLVEVLKFMNARSRPDAG